MQIAIVGLAHRSVRTSALKGVCYQKRYTTFKIYNTALNTAILSQILFGFSSLRLLFPFTSKIVYLNLNIRLSSVFRSFLLLLLFLLYFSLSLALVCSVIFVSRVFNSLFFLLFFFFFLEIACKYIHQTYDTRFGLFLNRSTADPLDSIVTTRFAIYLFSFLVFEFTKPLEKHESKVIPSVKEKPIEKNEKRAKRNQQTVERKETRKRMHNKRNVSNLKQ